MLAETTWIRSASTFSTGPKVKIVRNDSDNTYSVAFRLYYIYRVRYVRYLVCLGVSILFSSFRVFIGSLLRFTLARAAFFRRDAIWR